MFSNKLLILNIIKANQFIIKIKGISNRMLVDVRKRKIIILISI